MRKGVARFPKLTIEQVREIKRILIIERRSRELTGRTMKPKGMLLRLAAANGVSVSCIKLIDKNERWRDVKVKVKVPKLLRTTQEIARRIREPVRMRGKAHAHVSQ